MSCRVMYATIKKIGVGNIDWLYVYLRLLSSLRLHIFDHKSSETVILLNIIAI